MGVWALANHTRCSSLIGYWAQRADLALTNTLRRPGWTEPALRIMTTSLRLYFLTYEEHSVTEMGLTMH